jgi:uncharacterized protein (TIGR01777 family)
MIIGITGTSGFVGRALTACLTKAGHQVRAISLRAALPPDALAGIDAVVNLAGEPVGQRWTPAARERILNSRVLGTRALVNAMRGQRVHTLVSASAVGYYGSCGDTILTESSPAANDFLGQVAQAWEREAMEAEALGVRVTRVRLGLVLGRNGGALQKMLLPFKLGLGGPLAGGKQWMPWVHMDDLVSLIEFLLRESTVRGVFNAVAPFPVTNAEFTRALGEAVHRPAVIPVPGFALRLLLGEMAELILGSQRAIPDAAVRAGFTFRHPDVFGALADAA